MPSGDGCGTASPSDVSACHAGGGCRHRHGVCVCVCVCATPEEAAGTDMGALHQNTHGWQERRGGDEREGRGERDKKER